MNTLAIERMSTAEKLQVMEELWASLSAPGAELESPAWHAGALRETEKRHEAGLEQPLDWPAAKEKLRKPNK